MDPTKDLSALYFPPPPTHEATTPLPPNLYPPSSSTSLGTLHSQPSTLSLRPSIPHPATPDYPYGHSRRRLLIIYIHGFYGNDDSFRSFPLHIHNALKPLLSTHAIHSKIYPRYKTYRAISVGRDIFSEWLRPHEDAWTDVVLVGHSMGGILAAEVALLRGPDGQKWHNVIGILALDSPFLGVHPGVIGSGIASLFSGGSPVPEFYEPPEPVPPSSISRHKRTDTSIFNPEFINDVRLVTRPFMDSVIHFYRKHTEAGMVGATKMQVVRHLEYCGCLVDFPGLMERYNQTTAMRRRGEMGFVNYYTKCDGREKIKDKQSVRKKSDEDSLSPEDSRRLSTTSEYRGRSLHRASLDSYNQDLHSTAHSQNTSISPAYIQTPSYFASSSSSSRSPPREPPASPTDNLPPAPPSPTLFATLDKATRNHLEKAYKESLKSYEKNQKKLAKETAKVHKAAVKAEARRLQRATWANSVTDQDTTGTPKATATATISPQSALESLASPGSQDLSAKSKKMRKFCTVPRAPSPSWEPVFMAGVDEVGAHCGLFAKGNHYEKLLGDVVERIVGWVGEEMSRREIERMQREDDGTSK